jgi:hypothetical protein
MYLTKAKKNVLRALQTEIVVMDTFEILTFMSTLNRDFILFCQIMLEIHIIS